MTIPNHDANLLPPEDRDAPCRNCSHRGEDHEQDGTCLADVNVQRWTGDGECPPYWTADSCDCPGYEEYTRDDWEADEADRAYSEAKESGGWDW